MTELEIYNLLRAWQIYQHCGDFDKADTIEEELLSQCGLDMENNWEEILKNRGLI